MAIVMPRSRSSGALSMLSKERTCERPCKASVLVMAAVKLVLPWSTCPIVPTFTCGLVRANFCFPMILAGSFHPLIDYVVHRRKLAARPTRKEAQLSLSPPNLRRSPHPDLNRGPHSYQECALPAELCGPVAATARVYTGSRWARADSNHRSFRT